MWEVKGKISTLERVASCTNIEKRKTVMGACLKDIKNLDFFRRSRSQIFCKIGILKNFAKFTGKLCQSLFFNKVARPAILL